MSESMMRAGRNLRIGVTLLFVFCLLASGLYYAGHAAISDMLSVRVHSELSQLRERGHMPTPMQWREYHAALEAALSFAPDNPHYYEDTAYLYAVRGVAAMRFPSISKPLLGKALIYYQGAVSLLPMSSRTWANIALAKHYLDQNDAELWGAFDKAMEYGSNEPNTQVTLFTIGLQRWSDLEPQRQAALRASYARANSHLKSRFKNIAKQSNRREFM